MIKLTPITLLSLLLLDAFFTSRPSLICVFIVAAPPPQFKWDYLCEHRWGNIYRSLGNFSMTTLLKGMALSP